MNCPYVTATQAKRLRLQGVLQWSNLEACPMPRRSSLYNRWSLEMRRQGLFHSGERIGVAVSGGPDSVLLLNFLAQFSREAGLTLAVVHFNHHLRGEESDADEKFVRRLAR